MTTDPTGKSPNPVRTMLLLIAYGNPLRRDDGAGWLLASQLEQIWCRRQWPVDCLTVHQLGPELAEIIADPLVATVGFVDSRVVSPTETEPTVQIRPLNHRDSATRLGHYLNPELLLLYAHELYGRHPPAWLLTVPGIDFNHGEGLSELTHQAIINFLRCYDDNPNGS